ncbi:tripartite tricarboxylate transporter TctB family protein [Desulfomonile tiedjei]|uniref:Tripartite tricarboxylate transporter TctB family n=1 Tax=Desulfomonile tiedjei (strain ATCC 49306 / DSM 6799 / DCB-1) TaxID=706587 RepID=I4C8N2_DESTA|nr:tripartite tricarboxylate transporter TctB family protein [Desulfomonile tiedjei]AFM25923.1 Tripartite tricarboxylate transporter TctB family [Desulfomonile tiedjei DSM 6799]
MARTQSSYDRIASIFFIGVGLFFTLYARRVDIGNWNEPGPGFLPFWAGITLTIMAVALFIGSLRSTGVKLPPFFPQADSWKRVAATSLAMIVYALILNFVGFTIATFVFVGFLAKCIFPQTWMRTVIVAGLSALGARFLFIDLLKTQLPLGFLGF